MTAIMTEPLQNPRHRWFQVHLSTAILLVISIGMAGLVFVRGSAWYPENRTYTQTEFIARYPDWVSAKRTKSELEYHRLPSPDGTRYFYPGHTSLDIDNVIYDAHGHANGGGLFDFNIRDYGSEWAFLLNYWSAQSRLQSTAGFIDDNQCVMRFRYDRDLILCRVWHRRYPEWWWGHFYRPEVWAAGALGLMWIFKAMRFIRKRRGEPKII